MEVAATGEAALVRHGTARPGQFEREYDVRIRPNRPPAPASPEACRG
jgi:hypothetical protein